MDRSAHPPCFVVDESAAQAADRVGRRASKFSHYSLEKVFSDYLSLLHGFSHIPSSGDRNKKNGEWSVQDIS